MGTNCPENLTAIACDIANDIITQFMPDNSSMYTWIGCSNPGSCQDHLPPARDPTQQPVALQLTADIALAFRVLSRMSACVSPNVLQNLGTALRSHRDKARTAAGLFRTTLTPVERANPELWLAADRWADVDSAGFAIEETNQTGDWQLFRSGDGNGNFGLQEENGGVLLSSTVFVFQSGLL